MIIYAFLIGLVLPALLGSACLYPLRRKLQLSLNGYIGFSLLMGYGVICLLGTVLLMNQIPFSKYLVWFLACASLFWGIWLVLKYRSFFRFRAFSWNPAYVVILFLCGFSLVYSTAWPVLDWDAIALYDFRGRIFADGLVIEDMEPVVSDVGYFRYYYAYPLMTSLLHAWCYILGLSTPMIIYGGFYTAMGLILWEEVVHKKIQSTLIGFIPVCVLATPLLFSHASIAYTNLPYTAFYLAAVILAWRGLQERNGEHYLWLSAAMIIFSCLTRLNEPFYLAVLIPVVLYLFWQRKWLWAVLYGGSILIVRQLWTNYAVFDDALSASALPEIIKNFTIGFFIEVEAFLIANYIRAVKLPFAIGAGFAMMLVIKRIRIPIYWIIFGIINIGLLTFGGYFLASRFSFWKEIGGSAERMMIAFIPIFYLWSIDAWYYMNKKNES